MLQMNLTETQKIRLIAMCKVLYPDYYSFSICGSGIAGKETQILYGFSKTAPNFSMSCFEFVMLNLPEKLQKFLIKEGVEQSVYTSKPAFVGNIYGWKEGDRWNPYTEFDFAYPKAMQVGSSTYPKCPVDFLYNKFKKFKSNGKTNN